MAGAASKPSESPGAWQHASRRVDAKTFAAVFVWNQRRRPLASIGASGTGALTSNSAEQVVLQKDFLNVVDSGTLTGDEGEAMVVRDADGGMRFWLTIDGGGP